jgi:hypothetical protein
LKRGKRLKEVGERHALLGEVLVEVRLQDQRGAWSEPELSFGALVEDVAVERAVLVELKEPRNVSGRGSRWERWTVTLQLKLEVSTERCAAIQEGSV